MFYLHPYLGKIPNLTNIFEMGWFNYQLDNHGYLMSPKDRVFFSYKWPFINRSSHLSNPKAAHQVILAAAGGDPFRSLILDGCLSAWHLLSN